MPIICKVKISHMLSVLTSKATIGMACKIGKAKITNCLVIM